MSWFMGGGSSSTGRPSQPHRSYSTPAHYGTAHTSSGSHRKHSTSHHRSSSPTHSIHSSYTNASSKPQYYEVRHRNPQKDHIEYSRSVNGHGHSSHYAGSNFGGSHYGGSSSYYRRSRAMPRSGYMHRLMYKIRRLLRELYRYVRRHPIKVLLPIVMAVVSSGALHQVARKMGVPIPNALAQMVGAGRSAKGGYDAWYGDDDDGYGYSERRYRKSESSGGLGSLFGGGGGGGNAGMVKGAMKVASAFL